MTVGTAEVTYSYVGFCSTSYPASATKPTSAGTYSVTATVAADSNHSSASSSATDFTIGLATATVTLSNLNQTYDGTPKSVTVTTVPDGLAVEVTYDPTPPMALGSYAVVATVTDPNYAGTASGTLVITPASVTHSVPLVVGWNLISFNVHPENTAIATVLSSIDGNYDLVYAWDATGGQAAVPEIGWALPPGIPGTPLPRWMRARATGSA